MQYDQLYSQNRFNPQILRYCGFQEAPSSTFPDELCRVQLTQKASCMRDTLMTAIWNFKRLQNLLIQAGTTKKWRFCHIILCTVPDTFSKIKSQFAFDQIIRTNSVWQVASFKTFFVPIGMNDIQLQPILNLCEVGGADWMSFPARYDTLHEQFGEIMKHIRTVVNINHSVSDSDREREQPLLANPFDTSSIALTISIEASSMMRGQKWQAIINPTIYLLRSLTNTDLVSGIIYNSKPRVIGQTKQKPVLEQQKQILRQLQNQNSVAEPRYEEYARFRFPNPRQICARLNPLTPRQKIIVFWVIFFLALGLTIFIQAKSL